MLRWEVVVGRWRRGRGGSRFGETGFWVEGERERERRVSENRGGRKREGCKKEERVGVHR